VTKVVPVKAGSKQGFIRVDCVGTHGDLKVTITSLGGTDTKCGTKNRKGTGRVFLVGQDDLPAKLTIKVTSDSRNTWSVAVDTGAKVAG
jgi:hypothetical protein